MEPDRMLPSAALLLLTFFVSMGNTNSSFNIQALHFRIHQNDHLALATCNSLWNYSDLVWIQELPRPSSHWTLPSTDFHDMIENNIHNYVKTIIIVPEHERNVSTCLEARFSNENSFYLVDWITHDKGAQVEPSMEHATRRMHGKSLVCSALDDNNHTSGDQNNARFSPRSTPPLNLYSLDCARAAGTKEVTMKLWKPLKNSVVRAACYNTAYNEWAHPCHHSSSQLIIKALHLLNATILRSLYVNPDDLYTGFTKGTTDIHLDMCVVRDSALHRCTFSPPLYYTYETFYAKRGTTRPVSLFFIVMESKPALYLVLMALAFAFLVLGMAHIFEFPSTSLTTTLDSVMSLVASFYATSSPIPCTRRWTLSRAIVYGVWLVAILPFSSYIRSELTSRLTWRSPLESHDSLEELMDALDARRISLCVIAAHAVKSDLERNYTGTALYAKLHSLYVERTKGTELVTNRSANCFICASRENHVCLAEHIRNWCVIAERLGDGIAKSTERLRPLFGASPIRKNYPSSRAYHDLVRRLFEAPIGHLSNIKDEAFCPKEEASEQQSDQKDAFALFFLYFFGFLGTAAAILVIEIVIGRCRYQTDVRLLSASAKTHVYGDEQVCTPHLQVIRKDVGSTDEGPLRQGPFSQLKAIVSLKTTKASIHKSTQ